MNLLRVFDFLCFAHNKKVKRNNFTPKSRKYVFLRYSTGRKGGRCMTWRPEIFVCRDVQFFEHSLPYITSCTSPNISPEENGPFPILPSPHSNDPVDPFSPTGPHVLFPINSRPYSTNLPSPTSGPLQPPDPALSSVSSSLKPSSPYLLASSLIKGLDPAPSSAYSDPTLLDLVSPSLGPLTSRPFGT